MIAPFSNHLDVLYQIIAKNKKNKRIFSKQVLLFQIHSHRIFYTNNYQLWYPFYDISEFLLKKLHITRQMIEE
jgi:hypothetical protein